jgi:hypothetical protein
LDSADAIVPGVVIQAINEETGVHQWRQPRNGRLPHQLPHPRLVSRRSGKNWFLEDRSSRRRRERGRHRSN